MTKLKEGEEVTINIPFTYTIGEEGPITGNLLETIQDCKDEVEAEVEQGLSNIEVTVEGEDDRLKVFAEVEKGEKIKYIKEIIAKFGSFSTADVEADSSPCIESSGNGKDNYSTLLETFDENTAIAISYYDQIEVNSDTSNYVDLSFEIIEEIVILAEAWEAISLQTEKRIED